MRVQRTMKGVVVQTTNNQYAFHYLKGDEIRGGTKADIEGDVTYVGDNLGKHYVRSHDFEEVPEDVLEAVRERGVTVLDGVEGGWASWEGRPELSTTYVDISDASPI